MLKKFWPVIALLSVGISCYVSNASLLVAVSSLVGISYVVLVAYGHWSANVFGALLGGLFGWLSYEAGFFGNAAINMLFTIPASLWGIWYWKKHQGEKPTELGKNTKIGLLVALVVTSVFSMWLSNVYESNLWVLDGLTAVLPIFGTALLVTRCKEQWLVWIPYNVIEVTMWMWAAAAAPEVLAILAMRIVFMLNSIYGYHLWNKS
ncbi:MAG: nicotinamide riboside transporter PnuC [Bacteroidales bacterium]